MKKENHIDLYDRKIIETLMEDGRIPVTELAKRIGISKSPCQARLKRLQKEKFIIGFRVRVDYAKLDMEHVAFVEAKMHNTSEEVLAAFNKAVELIPEIEQCYLIAGAFDYLIKVRTADMGAYRKVLGESISKLPGVSSTSTYVSMQPIKE